VSGDVLTSTFEDVVAGLESDTPCDYTNNCPKSADWYVLYHGCGEYMLCDEHLRNWLKESSDKLARMGRVCCFHCQQFFTSIQDICKAIPL
jgi:hypothetical protein